MAPGTNCGSSKGGAAQPTATGTIPKIKARKKTSRSNCQVPNQSQQNQRIQLQRSNYESPNRIPFQGSPHKSSGNSLGSNQRVIFNNVPKNQIHLKWQPRESSGHRTCCTQSISTEFCESDGSDSQDKRPCQIFGNHHRETILEVNGTVNTQHTINVPRHRMNGNDLVSASPSEIVSPNSTYVGDTANHNSLSSSENNLQQENLCLASNDVKKMNAPSMPEQMQVAIRLNQIQDYIKQTSSLIEALEFSNSAEKNESRIKFLKDILKDLCDSERKLLPLLSAFDNLTKEDLSEVGCVTEEESGCCLPLCSDTSSARCSPAANHSDAVSQTSEKGKSKDLKPKVEETVQKLEHAALLQKRMQERDELQDAHRTWNYLMSLTTSRPRGEFEGEGSAADTEDRLWDGIVRKIQDQDEGGTTSVKVKNQMTNGDSHRFSPNREHKIQDLQRKKLHMDFLTADLSASLKELSAEDEVKEQASSEDSAVEDALDECADARAHVRMQGQIIREKVAELNALRLQLEQAKSFMNTAQKRDPKTATLEDMPASVPVDQTANILRQKRLSSDRGVSPEHVDRKQGTPSLKQQQLELEKAKLKRLQEILVTIQELHSSGLPLPEQLINELGCEAQERSCASLSTSPSHTVAQEEEEEDAAAEADGEEDDEPEASVGWNQQQMSLSESAIMASDLSEGLQQRAAQLRVERDGLVAMQRQLDSLFSQLSQPTQDAVVSDVSLTSSTTSQHRSEQNPKVDGAAQKRVELFSEIQRKWQLLQDEIACDTSLNARAAPFLAATMNFMNAVAAHVIPNYETEDRASSPEQSVPAGHRQRELPSQHIQQQPSRPDFQISSAPSTLMRKKTSDISSVNERAVWSSSALEDSQLAETSAGSHRQRHVLLGDDNPPIISMPTPSPQHGTAEMQSRLAALSQSCQSLYSSSTIHQPMLTASIPLPPLPPPPPPPGSASHDREAYYQQLLAAGQLQQQQVLLTAVNQCFQLLKVQQHELRSLSDAVHLLSAGHAIAPPSAACPPTLNNQVPPGNRTNNYWDNFRSYSRQNLLSTSAKSNEGLSHSPSPLVERSHNALRSSTPVTLPGQAVATALAHTPAASAPLAPMAAVAPAPPALCLAAGVGAGAGQAITIGTEVVTPEYDGAVGPVPPIPAVVGPSGIDFSSPLVQNIPRKDKRNLEHFEGGIGSHHRQASSETDHRTLTRALEDVALPIISPSFSSHEEEFEVPPMPILRNPTAGLHSRLNHLNFNASSSVLLDSSETPSTRNQLNNEGVPFSEISTTLSNQHLNEFGGFCSVDQVRDSLPRHLNMGYNNTSAEIDTSSVVHKRNTGAIKRTLLSIPNMSNNASAFAPTNYQRNIHAPTAPLHLSPTNSPGHLENSNFTQKLSSMFVSSNSDSESILKSSKHQLGQDCSRNFGTGNRRSIAMEEFQSCRTHSSLPLRSRIRDSDEADGHSSFREDISLEYEDAPVLCLGFNSPSSTSGPSSSSQNIANVEVHNFGSGKNQLKESCFQIRKCPKFQSKSGPRGQITDSAAAAAAVAAVAAVSSNSTPHRSCSSASSGNRRRFALKNNQGSPNSNTSSCHSELYDEVRDAVYTEITSLISANENRPSAILKLFRDLQQINAGPLRQTTLQLIQQAVSRYQMEGRSLSPTPQERQDEDEERLSRASAGGCSSTLDAKDGENLMQLVLGLELASVLSAHGDEMCSSSLMEEIRQRLLQLVPVPSSASNVQASNAARAGYYLHSQISTLLERLLVKFQGCRIGDIGQEMTSDIVNSLPTRLMYHRMVDFYGRNNSEAEADLNKDVSCPQFRAVGGTSPVKTSSPLPHDFLLLPQHTHPGHSQSSRQEVELISEASHGDLAEADQSQHLDVAEDDETAEGDRDSEADRERSESSASASESASALHVHVYQLSTAAELDSEPEVEALLEESEATECHVISAHPVLSRNEAENAAVGVSFPGKGSEDTGQSSLDLNPSLRNQVEMEGAWGLNQDCEREQEEGLDQVPTRLACDSDRDQENGEKRRSLHLPSSSNAL